MLFKNKLFSLVFFGLIVVCSLFVITGCDKNSDLLDQKSITQDNVVDQIISEGLLGIWPASFFDESQEISPLFINLSEEKFDEYFNTAAKIFVNDFYESWPKEIRNSKAKDEIIGFYTDVYKNINILSAQKYHKTFNYLTKDEALTIIDDDYDDIVESILQNNRDNEYIQYYWYNVIDTPSSLTLNELSTRSCPQYSFPICTNITTTYNRNCTGVASATYPSASDCDYEFIFDWPHFYTPTYCLSLRGEEWRVRLVLNEGGIQGRVQTTPNQVRFLIGKNRVKVTGGTSNYISNLKGYWWFA